MMSLLISFTMVSCIDDDNDELTGNAVTGGLVNANNLLISYVVGSGNTYSATGTVTQGNVQTTSINVYKTFVNSATGAKSNRALLQNVPISNTTTGSVSSWQVSFDYDSLKDGLTIDGAPLPDTDGGLNIGDYWNIEYESVTSEGNSNNNYSSTKVAVGTRYAGVYTVEDSAYWNSGSLLGNWSGGDRIIESVNATIYRHVGLAYWDDNEFYFTVDNTTNVITVLDKDLSDADLLLNGSPVMTCTGGTGDFEVLTCDDSTSRAIPNDVTGEDVLEFTVGYFRGVGATREFFERLVKQVD